MAGGGDGRIGQMNRADAMLIVEMKRHFQLRAIEWWSAAVMATWGFFVLLVPTLFAINPACRGLLVFAPQQVWGLVALIAGSVRLIALTINGFWYRTPIIRWATAMLSILIWFLVAAAFIEAPIVNMGVLLYGWLMIADMYSAYRSASDYVEASAQRALEKHEVARVAGNVKSICA